MRRAGSIWNCLQKVDILNALNVAADRFLILLMVKGLEINNSLELAHRFRADLVDPIEQNRKRSRATFRISESHKLAYL